MNSQTRLLARYRMKQKWLSWGDDYVVQDETSELDVRAKDDAYVYHWYAKGGRTTVLPAAMPCTSVVFMIR